MLGDGLGLTGCTGHENLILLFLIAVRQDISALKRLWEETEDVVDHEDARLRAARARGVCLHAINSGVFTLFLIAVAYNRWHCAAGVRLRHRGVCSSNVELWF